MERINFFRVFLLLFIISLTHMQLAAQESDIDLILAGPDRTIILVKGAFVNQADGLPIQLSSSDKIIVERSDNNGRSYKRIGEAQFPKSALELGDRLGGFSNDVLEKLNVKTIDEAYRILTTQTVDTLGLLLMSVHIQEALGITFIDTKRDSKVNSVYKLTNVKENSKDQILLPISAQLPTYTHHFKTSTLSSSDSSLSVTWKAAGSIEERQLFPLIAKIYKQNNSRGTFDHYSSKYLLQDDSSLDSLVVSLSEPIEPGQNVGFYFQIEDVAGNKGISSDTVYTLAVSRSHIKPISRLTTIDTMDAVLLKWDAIPNEAVYGGIQILKSRKVNSDYVVLDTVPINDTSYWDFQIIPGSSYHYRVRPLLLNIPNSDPMMFAEAVANVGVKDDRVPSKPSGLRIRSVDRGIEVRWDNGPELNLFGYYVLRGTSNRDMEVIANAVQTHHYIDTLLIPKFSGQLHYAVQAISQNQSVSDTSEFVSINVQQPVHINPPGGLQVRWSDIGVSLNWENAMQRDDRILGYVIYRKESKENVFTALNKQVHQIPYYIDSTANLSVSYDYAITSIDSWGNQSVYSELSSVEGQYSRTLVLPQELYLRNLSNAIEIFWPVATSSTTQKYIVYRRTNSQLEFIKIGESQPDKPFLDKNVISNQLYEYAIKINDSGVEYTEEVRGSIRKN